jgi:lipopolysaccharide/colanic/teichoic acid biosynthesis glycosyltransferase
LPGITGWAQVNGLRGPTEIKGTMDKRFQHDLYYIKNWNLMLDFYILIRTIFVVLFQKVD